MKLWSRLLDHRDCIDVGLHLDMLFIRPPKEDPEREVEVHFINGPKAGTIIRGVLASVLGSVFFAARDRKMPYCYWGDSLEREAAACSNFREETCAYRRLEVYSARRVYYLADEA